MDELAASLSCMHQLPQVRNDKAEFFLDVTDNLPLSSDGEAEASLSQHLLKIFGDLTASKVVHADSMMEGISFVDGDGVGDI